MGNLVKKWGKVGKIDSGKYLIYWPAEKYRKIFLHIDLRFFLQIFTSKMRNNYQNMVWKSGEFEHEIVGNFTVDKAVGALDLTI